MPKNAIKPEAVKLGHNDLVNCEAAEPYSEKTALGGPIPKIGSHGVMPCRVQLSSKILTAAGMKPRDHVELISEAGQIVVKKTGGPEPSIWSASEPRPSARKIQLDDLMEFAREKEARARGEFDDEEPEEPLSDEQVSREEL